MLRGVAKFCPRRVIVFVFFMCWEKHVKAVSLYIYISTPSFLAARQTQPITPVASPLVIGVRQTRAGSDRPLIEALSLLQADATFLACRIHAYTPK